MVEHGRRVEVCARARWCELKKPHVLMGQDTLVDLPLLREKNAGGAVAPPPSYPNPNHSTHARHTKPTTSSTSAIAMQTLASDSERFPDRYVVRLSGALAALLGRAEGRSFPRTTCWAGCGRRG